MAALIGNASGEDIECPAQGFSVKPNPGRLGPKSTWAQAAAALLRVRG